MPPFHLTCYLVSKKSSYKPMSFCILSKALSVCFDCIESIFDNVESIRDSIGEFDSTEEDEEGDAVEVEELQPISFCRAVACCLSSAACSGVSCPLPSFASTWFKNAPIEPQAACSLLFSRCFMAAFNGACKLFAVLWERSISSI